MAASDSDLFTLIGSFIAGDDAAAGRMLLGSPALAKARFQAGATRAAAKKYFIEEIKHHIYAGDTALHIAAAAYREAVVRTLLAMGADVHAKNRRGAEPLHYAVDGIPGWTTWDPSAQAATVACLIAGGADPNAIDKGGVTPLHRAVRNRCADAVRALLAGGADVRRRNNSGSTPMQLAGQNTGRGGSGTPEAKQQQDEIVRLLAQHGAVER